MSKTNSNSITSILIYALNKRDSSFRREMIKFFNKRGANLSERDDIEFYDGTHSPLKYKSMKNKEVDIYARIRGKYKVLLMIEVKAGINETLQKSQQQNGEYYKTSITENIPLFFIIPKLYAHRNKLSFLGNNVIEWEEIMELSGTFEDETDIGNQINNFVEVTNQESYIPNIVKELYDIKRIDKLLKNRRILKNSLKDCINITSRKKFSESEYEFGYYWNNGNYFLGYNYFLDKYILSFDIAETKLPGNLNKNDFTYLDGWFFIPAISIDKSSPFTIQNLEKSIREKDLLIINSSIIQRVKRYIPEDQQIAYQIRTTFTNLFNSFIENNQNLKKTNSQDNEFGSGFYFSEKNKKNDTFFIGLSPTFIGTDQEKNSVSVAYKPKKKDIKCNRQFSCIFQK